MRAMTPKTPSFSIGIEEEYLLVDRETRAVTPEPPKGLLQRLEKRIEGQVSPEFLRSQIEVGTRVCHSPAEARGELHRLRSSVAEVAAEFGLAPIAASTHPFSKWREQTHTDKDRYISLARDFQVVARRLLICGMHVHVGIEDEELRIDLMNQAAYFLPHLLALSTSSPFWQGGPTGLKSYRLAVFDELPRSGLPPKLSGWTEYRRTVDLLVGAGLIEDATKIWWDLRPSDRFPTIEMRVTDVCSLIDDGVAIAALFVCICRMLYRLRRENQRWRTYLTFLIRENRWRAQRYGIGEGLVDFGKGEVVPFATLLDELLDLTREDAEFFGCVDEVEHARTIVKRGTSADRQLAVFEEMTNRGASEERALLAVVDSLIEETATGVPSTPDMAMAE